MSLKTASADISSVLLQVSCFQFIFPKDMWISLPKTSHNSKHCPRPTAGVYVEVSACGTSLLPSHNPAQALLLSVAIVSVPNAGMHWLCPVPTVVGPSTHHDGIVPHSFPRLASIQWQKTFRAGAARLRRSGLGPDRIGRRPQASGMVVPLIHPAAMRLANTQLGVILGYGWLRERDPEKPVVPYVLCRGSSDGQDTRDLVRRAASSGLPCFSWGNHFIKVCGLL
ncbi:hypothetical protein OH76DRAFT_189731 [Lentinus brumalis]|uniref:Uncharacterized protein n=1 Tax=Lentinus brumalis TaxID=2498619 RepID=A0A371CN03_9APHY|nr:hypothetical protein OH76DRAFT_189731 [Polyporus brumalis]